MSNRNPHYLAPITEEEAHDYFVASGSGPIFGDMQYWDRPPTPFRHIEGSVENDPEHIDTVFGSTRRYVPLAPARTFKQKLFLK